jgi:hypothetical protein
MSRFVRESDIHDKPRLRFLHITECVYKAIAHPCYPPNFEVELSEAPLRNSLTLFCAVRLIKAVERGGDG